MGMNLAEIQKAGVKLRELGQDDPDYSKFEYAATALPIRNPIFVKYTMLVTPKNGLCDLTAYSGEYKSLEKAEADYNLLVRQLENQYGVFSDVDSESPTKMFIWGALKSGDRPINTAYRTISIHLVGGDSSLSFAPFIMLSYTGTRYWTECHDEVEEADRADPRRNGL